MAVNKKQTILIISLFVLLFLCLGLLGYIYRNTLSSSVKDANNVEQKSLETNLGILYLLEVEEVDESVTVGIQFVNSSVPEYRIIKQEKKLFDDENLLALSQKKLPSYVTIQKEREKYYIELKGQNIVNEKIVKKFTNNLSSYLEAQSDGKVVLKPYEQYWLLSELYTVVDDEKSKNELKDFALFTLNENIIKFKNITNDEFGTGEQYIRNYSRNYPYSCFVNKMAKDSNITSIDASEVLCDLPIVPLIDKQEFDIENIETVWNNSKNRTDGSRININTVYSTTLLLDYWAKGEQNLTDIYRYSLSEAYKFGMSKADVCYWMLVNDLTEYKNNLYNYIIHDEMLFNSFNGTYCPSLHMPIYFESLNSPRAMDINYVVYDL